VHTDFKKLEGTFVGGQGKPNRYCWTGWWWWKAERRRSALRSSIRRRMRQMEGGRADNLKQRTHW